MEPVLTERYYNIHYYEVDYNKKCLPTAFMNYFQDIAIMQSELQGIGLDFLAENNYAWMLYQWDINIYSYPLFGQKVKVNTMATSLKGVKAYRTFNIFDENNNLLVYAASIWSLFDIQAKKICSVPPVIKEGYGVSDDKAKPLKLSKPSEPSRVDCQKNFDIRYSDIDTNMHVNNSKYVEWSLETLPLELYKTHSLSNIKVLYKNQGKYGDTIKVHTELTEDQSAVITKHKITDIAGSTLCFIENSWE